MTTEKASILIVDDDPVLRLLTREALEKDGFEVLEADNGLQALDTFAAVTPKPVLVISDVMMPRMDGFAMCAVLRERDDGRHVPVLMVTGLEDVASISQAYQAGATDFIVKPLNWHILSHRVQYMLRASVAFAELYRQQQRTALLEEIAVRANSVDLLADVLQFALEHIAQFTGATLGHALLRQSGKTPSLAVGARWSRDPGRFASFHNLTSGTVFERNDCLAGRVLATGRAEWIDDITRDAEAPRLRAAATAGLKSAFAFPVMVGEEVVVVLEFFADHQKDADEDFLQLTAQIGSQLGRVMERKNAQEKLIHNATHDALTGLPNRLLLLDRLKRAVTMHRRYSDYQFALLFIDLDSFKVVNDSLGHPIGDKLLIEVSARLNSIQRTVDLLARNEMGGEGEVLARMGGDEFTLLLDDIRYASDAVRVANRVHKALREPFTIDGHEVHVSASVGIATSETDYTSADDVLRDADLAMYRAKTLGKARSEVFDQTMHANAVKRLQLESNLRGALEQQQFRLHYQPLVSLETGEVGGFEALLRWQRPDGEMIYPGDFIHVAEDTGLILHIGLWVIEEACRTVSRWHRDHKGGGKLPTIAINLSPRQFSQPELVAHIRRILDETGIDPGTVSLEITEGVAMSDSERATRVLWQLRELGVKSSIDDFGTGFSSLSYLHRFPLDTLKIDRSFIAQIDRGREGFQMVKTIIELARNLGMKIVAEGTETQAHVTHLKSLGCDFGQGYFFSRAVDSETAVGFMKKLAKKAEAGTGTLVANA